MESWYGWSMEAYRLVWVSSWYRCARESRTKFKGHRNGSTLVIRLSLFSPCICENFSNPSWYSLCCQLLLKTNQPARVNFHVTTNGWYSPWEFYNKIFELGRRRGFLILILSRVGYQNYYFCSVMFHLLYNSPFFYKCDKNTLHT